MKHDAETAVAELYAADIVISHHIRQLEKSGEAESLRIFHECLACLAGMAGKSQYRVKEKLRNFPKA